MRPPRHPRHLATATLALALLLSAAACCKNNCARTASAASTATATTAPISLFNGKDLAGWTPRAKDNSADATGTWAVKNGVITGTGKPYGCLRTDKRYANYRLTVEWRWLEGTRGSDEKGNPRPRNSGVFLHTQDTTDGWPDCIEAQLQEDHAGDFIISPAINATELTARRAAAIAAAGADETARKKAANTRGLPKKNPSSEKPAGQWNRYDIVCDGDTITLTVNGVEQNRLTGLTVREGHIALQAEGAPVEFRNITLAPLR